MCRLFLITTYPLKQNGGCVHKLHCTKYTMYFIILDYLLITAKSLSKNINAFRLCLNNIKLINVLTTTIRNWLLYVNKQTSKLKKCPCGSKFVYLNHVTWGYYGNK